VNFLVAESSNALNRLFTHCIHVKLFPTLSCW